MLSPEKALFAYQRKGNQLIVLLLIPLPQGLKGSLFIYFKFNLLNSTITRAKVQLVLQMNNLIKTH